MKLKLIEFIENNKNWEELLLSEPYCLTIKRDNGYIILNYDQNNSDLCNEIVRECRGIILYEKTLKPVCVPFFKFDNYAETKYKTEIDWESAKVQEKVDGSIIKVWYDRGKWRVSTNATIDAFKCDLHGIDEDCVAQTEENKYKFFGDLFQVAKEKVCLNFEKLNKNYTYIFELVSPYNKVVVYYKDFDLYHIGTRDNITYEELNVDIGIKKPKEYDLHSLEDCVEVTNKMSYNEEGFVVVDKYWNRVKIKSPEWTRFHYFKNNGNYNLLNIIQIIRENELGELLSYFPELVNIVNATKDNIKKIVDTIKKELDVLKTESVEDRKAFALKVSKLPYSKFYFDWYKDITLTPESWVWGLDNYKLKDMIKDM